MSLVSIDGDSVVGRVDMRADVVVVGTGPGGASVARSLALAGVDVVVLEEGREHLPSDFHDHALRALSTLYRRGGVMRTVGRRPMPVLQAVALGGTSVVNSGICWPLPEHVHGEWVRADPDLAASLPLESLRRIASGLERDLNVRPTTDDVAGGSARLMAAGAEALGLAHQPTRRNVRDCQGLGRCNLGCAAGAKLSMDRSFLPDAVASGARIVTSARVTGIVVERDAARAVVAVTGGGGHVRVIADRAVVLAAGTLHSPALLLSNGIGHGPVGRHLQCHPGLAVVGRFPEQVRSARNATQGYEVTGLLSERLKLETLVLPPALLAARLDRVGAALVAATAELDHWAAWDALIRAEAEGGVTVRRCRPRTSYRLTAADIGRAGAAVRWLSALMFAAGATEVVPGVAGIGPTLTPGPLLDDLPWDAGAYRFTASHLFGTCRLGTDPATSVVGPDLAHHRIKQLVVADASVFPTNLGVNPQLSIMTLAVHAAEAILRTSPPGAGRARPGRPVRWPANAS